MRSIKGYKDGKRILLPIAVLAARDPTDLTFGMYVALLDTGATASWVSSDIVRRFDLRPIGKRPCVVATEVRQLSSYIFRLGLIGDDEAPTALPFVFAETIGFEIKQANGFDVLLGMDVLSETDFIMRRDGSWELSFGR